VKEEPGNEAATVTIEKFNEMLDRFGPLQTDNFSAFLNRILITLSER